MRRRPQKPEENVDAWLMSYADMITLLMCFFIIFVSVSEPKRDRLTEIAEGMSGKFGAVHHSTPLKDAVQALHAVVEKNGIYRDVAISRLSNGVELELASGQFFLLSSAEFDTAMRPKLDALMQALQQSDLSNFYVVIESHTDVSLPETGLYPTNWDLSAARAARLARIFTEHGFAADGIKATAFADSRPRVPHYDAQGSIIEQNRARNNRILIRLERVG